jgi:hypothetical protein
MSRSKKKRSNRSKRSLKRSKRSTSKPRYISFPFITGAKKSKEEKNADKATQKACSQNLSFCKDAFDNQAFLARALETKSTVENYLDNQQYFDSLKDWHL